MRHQDLNPPAIVKAAKTLEEELAQKIQEREDKIVETTLEHARLQGADLMRVKQHLGPRKFAPWLKANVRFSRQAAYKYMRIADNWDLICKRRLQMASLEEVHRKLFNKVKAQKGCTSSHEDEPTMKPESSSSKDREPSAVTVQAEGIEATADPTRVVADQSKADVTVQQQPPAKHADTADDQDHSESRNETSNEAQKSTQQPNPGSRDDAVASSPKSALVMPIKDPRVHDYFQSLKNELLECHRQGKLRCGALFPPEVSEIMRAEDPAVQLFLGLVPLGITMWKHFEKKKESSSSQAKKKQQKGRHTRK